MALRVREMTPEEIATIKRRAHARRLRARQVERARIIWLTRHGWGMPAIAKELPLTQVSVRNWLKRFTAQGLAGLEDQPWSDQPVMSRPAQVVEVIATALTDPQHLGWPFALWTLYCLETDLNEEKGIAIKRSQIGRAHV